MKYCQGGEITLRYPLQRRFDDDVAWSYFRGCSQSRGAAMSIQILEEEGGKTYHDLLRKTSLCEFLAAISYVLCGIVRSLRTATKNYVHIRITLK